MPALLSCARGGQLAPLLNKEESKMAKQTNPTPAPERASTSDVTFTFVSREDGPERLVSEVELVFPSTGILSSARRRPRPRRRLRARSEGSAIERWSTLTGTR